MMKESEFINTCCRAWRLFCVAARGAPSEDPDTEVTREAKKIRKARDVPSDLNLDLKDVAASSV